jgi:hypothetical protein
VRFGERNLEHISCLQYDNLHTMYIVHISVQSHCPGASSLS